MRDTEHNSEKGGATTAAAAAPSIVATTTTAATGAQVAGNGDSRPQNNPNAGAPANSSNANPIAGAIWGGLSKLITGIYRIPGDIMLNPIREEATKGRDFAEAAYEASLAREKRTQEIYNNVCESLQIWERFVLSNQSSGKKTNESDKAEANKAQKVDVNVKKMTETLEICCKAIKEHHRGLEQHYKDANYQRAVFSGAPKDYSPSEAKTKGEEANRKIQAILPLVRGLVAQSEQSFRQLEKDENTVYQQIANLIRSSECFQKLRSLDSKIEDNSHHTEALSDKLFVRQCVEAIKAQNTSIMASHSSSALAVSAASPVTGAQPSIQRAEVEITIATTAAVAHTAVPVGELRFSVPPATDSNATAAMGASPTQKPGSKF